MKIWRASKEKQEIFIELTNFRKAFGLPQEVMARIFGLGHAKTISQWEYGRRQPPILLLKVIRVLMATRGPEAWELLSKLESANKPTKWSGSIKRSSLY